MEFPTQDNSDQTTIYYGISIYGPYYYYYDYPWWLDAVPPATSPVTEDRSGNPEISKLRNTGDRGTPTRFPELQPPTRNRPITIDKGNSNNSGGSSTETTVRSSSSGNSGTNSGSQRSSSSSSNVRNSNGGRSSGGRR